ncbi:tRNA-dihydrouridine synthase [Patescibacteria group bacterium]|nr:tRNA-dihydrouridine synthase [Patescibacteria group bacterium]
MANFWKKLGKPFLVLAPMDDVTDYVFREIISRLAKPDVMFTEFTSADGLMFEKNEHGFQKLKFSERQRPVVSQIWGGNPETISKAGSIVEKMGFDGIDLNMGCPDRNVMKKHGGAGIIGNYELAATVISAAKKGAPSLPLSVKTRLGNEKTDMADWISFLLKQNLDALTVYARKPEQLSKGPTFWDDIGRIVKMRNELAPGTTVIGNGDIKSYEEAMDKYKKYGVDGLMIGRGIFQNPWIFEKSPKKHSRDEYLKVLTDHMDLFVNTWGGKKNFAILKKFFKVYVKDFNDATTVRERLMKANDRQEVEKILEKIS